MITTDACTKGWGACRESMSTGGHFTALEKIDHINVLELRPSLFGPKISV